MQLLLDLQTSSDINLILAIIYSNNKYTVQFVLPQAPTPNPTPQPAPQPVA